MKRPRHMTLVELVLAAVTGVLASGCGTSPSAPAPIRAPAGVTLPIATRVAVQVNAAMPDMQTVEFRGETWQYADAELMQQAALRVFRLVFAEVGTPPGMSEPAVTLQLTGSSSVNPVMSEYYANATVTAFPGTNTSVQPIVSVAGTGQASQPNFARAGITQAYEGAFRQVADLLLADPRFIASLRGN